MSARFASNSRMFPWAVMACFVALAVLLMMRPALRTPAEFGPLQGFELDEEGEKDGVSSIALPPVQPARALVTAARGFSVGATRRVDLGLPGEQSWEPSIVVAHADANTAEGDEVVVTWMDGRAVTDTRIGMSRTIDGGNTWITSDLLPPAQSTNIQFDAMTAADPVTGRTYVGAMSRNFSAGVVDTVWLAGKAAGAASFSASSVVVPLEGVDKGWLAAGPLPAPASGSALYMAFRAGTQPVVRRSLNGGASFEAAIALPLLVAPHPRVSPNGTLSISYFNNQSGSAAFISSMDGLQTLSAPIDIATFSANPQALASAVPGDFRLPFFVMHSVDPNSGKLYVIYNDVTGTVGGQADVNLLLRDSVDGGQTWSSPRIVNGDGAPPGDQFMPWLECDSLGRLHLAWFDNRRHPDPDASSSTLVDVYYAMSSDGGLTWQETRLTQTPLNTSASNWNPSGAGFQFIGDYIGVAVSRHAAYVTYPGDAAGAVAMWVTRIDLDGDGIFANGFE
ncbi:MAG: hypothetical protein ABI411_18505 [Tahibacter sp.]